MKENIFQYDNLTHFDNKLPALLFDMDGTLTNLQKRWWDPMIEIIADINPNYDIEAISDNFPRIIELAGSASKFFMIRLIWYIGRIAKLTRFQTLKLLKRLNQNKEKFRQIYPLEGVEKILNILYNKGYPLALVTSASKKTVDKAKEVIPAFNLFETIVCKDDVKHIKPDPEALILACTKLGYDPRDAIMIGDFPLDIQAGKAINSKTIGIVGLGGIHTRPLLEESKPDILIETLGELIDSLTSMAMNVKGN